MQEQFFSKAAAAGTLLEKDFSTPGTQCRGYGTAPAGAGNPHKTESSSSTTEEASATL